MKDVKEIKREALHKIKNPHTKSAGMRYFFTLLNLRQ